MTRKRFIKKMMGRGVSRNVARELARTMIETKNVIGKMENALKNGEEEKAIRYAAMLSVLLEREDRWRLVAWMMEYKKAAEAEA